MKGKKCALKKTTGPSCFPSIFATKKKERKKAMSRQNVTECL